MCFPRTRRQNYYIWVVVDIFTKSTHFFPVKSTYSAEDYSKIYIDVIVSLHGILLSIILDGGSQFTSRFWRLLQKGLDTQVKLITDFHPQTNGQAERTIQTLMLRACIIDFRGSLDDHFHLVEFSYNNSYHSSISMAPFEVLYGRRVGLLLDGLMLENPRFLVYFIDKTLDKVHLIINHLQTSYSRQNYYADKRRRELEFEEGDNVYFKISPMKGVVRFVKKGKLSP